MGFGWGYGFDNYTGFPGYSYPYAGGGPPGLYPPAGPGRPEGKEGEDTFEHGDREKEKESGGVTGFVKGMANGAVNLVKGMFSPQGLVMTAGAIGLTWATGGAILPLLGVAGLATGGYQMLNGIAKGSSEAAGEGFFNLGFGLLGFAGSTSVKLAGKTFELHGGAPHEVPMKAGLLDQLKAPFGFAKYKNPETNQVMNMYQLSWRKFQENCNKLPGGAGASGGSAMAAAEMSHFQPSAPPEFALLKRQRMEDIQTNRLALEGMATRKEPFEKILANLKAVRDQSVSDPRNPKLIAEMERLQNEASKIHQSDHAAFLKEMKRLDEKESAVRGNLFQLPWSKNARLGQIEADRQKAITRILSKQERYSQKINVLIGETPVLPKDPNEQIATGLEHKVKTHKQNQEDLQWLYNLQHINKAESERFAEDFKLLSKSDIKHAERLQDLWNLKVLKLTEKNPDRGYAKYYRNRPGQNLDPNKQMSATKIHELKLEIMNHLNNNAMDDWQLPFQDRLWLAKESTNALYENLQKSDELKPFLPKKDHHKKMIGMLDAKDPKNMPTVQAYYKFLSSLHKNELAPKDRKELVAAFLKTQQEGVPDPKAILDKITSTLESKTNQAPLSDEDKNVLNAVKEVLTEKLLKKETLSTEKLNYLEKLISEKDIIKNLDSDSILEKVIQQQRLEHLVDQDQAAFQVRGGATYLGRRAMAFGKWMRESVSNPAKARENYYEKLKEADLQYNKRVFGHDVGNTDSLPVRIAISNDPNKLFAPWELPVAGPVPRWNDPQKAKTPGFFSQLGKWLGIRQDKPAENHPNINRWG